VRRARSDVGRGGYRAFEKHDGEHQRAKRQRQSVDIIAVLGTTCARLSDEERRSRGSMGETDSSEARPRLAGRPPTHYPRVALPEDQRQMTAGFEQVEKVPALEWPAGRVRIFSGTMHGKTSPAVHFSELLGADVQVHSGHSLTLPLDPQFEHALLVLDGDAAFNDQPLEDRVLYYVGSARSDMNVSSRNGGRLLLIGGPPFPEKILMWWNFVARTHEEIAQARTEWEEGQRFGEVTAYKGPRLSAPSLLRFARPNPVS
jgi:hypothetical protein